MYPETTLTHKEDVVVSNINYTSFLYSLLSILVQSLFSEKNALRLERNHKTKVYYLSSHKGEVDILYVPYIFGVSMFIIIIVDYKPDLFRVA